MKLTPKQKRFCEEYIVDLNATQAAIRAGYSQKTAAVIAAENLTKPNISNYVQLLQGERASKTEISAEWVLKNLKEIADEAKEKGEYSPANKSLELIGKHLGMFTEKIDLNADVEIEVSLSDE